MTTHSAYAKAADLRYGNALDPHAAVCVPCGWQGPMRMTREQATADADEHTGGEPLDEQRRRLPMTDPLRVPAEDVADAMIRRMQNDATP